MSKDEEPKESVPWMQFPDTVAEVSGYIPPCKECEHIHCGIQREHGDYVIASSLTRKLKNMTCGRSNQHG